MKEYTELAKEYLGENRNVTKDVYKIVGTIFRGVNNGKFTLEWALKKLETDG